MEGAGPGLCVCVCGGGSYIMWLMLDTDGWKCAAPPPAASDHQSRGSELDPREPVEPLHLLNPLDKLPQVDPLDKTHPLDSLDPLDPVELLDALNSMEPLNSFFAVFEPVLVVLFSRPTRNFTQVESFTFDQLGDNESFFLRHA